MAVIGKRQALIVLLGIGLLTILYFKSQSVDINRHNQIISELRELKRLVPIVKQNVLMVFIGKLNNYDPLVDNLADMRVLLADLKKEGSGIFGSSNVKIDLSIADFEDNINHLTQLVEDFKTSHSVYRNSSAYLSYFAPEIQRWIGQESPGESTGDGTGDGLPVAEMLAEGRAAANVAIEDMAATNVKSKISELHLALLQYQLSGSSLAKDQLILRMEELSRNAKNVPQELGQELSLEFAKKIGLLKKHVNIVVVLKQKLDLNLKDIFSQPTEKYIDAIFSNYTTYFDDLHKNVKIYQTILYVLSLLLLVYIAYIFIILRRTAVALKSANENLEERVDKRTSDLQEANEQLGREIIERTQAEKALRESEIRLQGQVMTLMDNEQRLEAQAMELVVLAEDMSVTRDELQKLNTQKDGFFAIIAHDLKSPFNALLGFSQILSTQIERLSQDKIVEYASLINNSADQAFKLLEDLLDWSRLQWDRIDFQPGPLDVNQLIKTNLDRFEPAARVKDIEIKGVNLDPLQVHADTHMLDTILRNLISNAIKFTLEGGRVTVTAVQKDDNFAEIVITDNGVGMAAGKIAGLFRLDEKSSTTGTRGETGTGLGLPLCKDFVEKQGGKISVESTQGKGSVFSFTLPIKPQT